MATATEEVKECPICAEPYINPKLLACHHTLCEACVNKIKTATKIQCPTCRRYSDVAQIVADFRFEKFLAALQEKDDEFAQIISSEPLETAPGHCELCTKNPVSFRCEDCPQWMCSDCKAIHLKTPVCKNHNIKKLSDKNKEFKGSLTTKMKALEKKIQEYRKCVTAFANEKDKTQTNQAKLLTQSRELRDACVLDLNKRFDKIDTKIISNTEKQIQLLHSGFVKFDNNLKELQSEWTKMNDILKKNSSQLTIDGESILKRAKQLVDSVESPDVQIESLDIRVCKGDAWDADQAVQLRIGGGHVQQGTGGSTVVTASKKNWLLAKQVTTPNCPACLRLIQQQLWQCCYECIQIYDTALNEQRRIQCKAMGWVHDVASIDTGDVVVAAAKGLYHMDTRGTRLHEMHKGWFTGVAVHAGLVYAAECGERGVCVYKYSSGWLTSSSWQLQRHFNLQCETRYNTKTLSVMNSSIILCFSDDHRIDVFTLTGDKQYSVGERGSQVRQLNAPYLCSVEPSGAMLVADHSNNRLQVMDASRQWSVVNLQPQPQQPYGAVLHAGKLYCNAYNKSELYMYE